MSMVLWQGTKFVWWARDLHKLNVFISMNFFPLLHEWNQFELCLQLQPLKILKYIKCMLKLSF
jgi:hypothetical protein